MSQPPTLLHPILHVATLLEDHLRNRLAPLGITPRQARILVALDRMGVASQIMLSEEFQVTAASMSTMTARLISHNYIQRDINAEDKRLNILQLTDNGRMFLTEVVNVWREVDEMIAVTLGVDAARRYVDGTSKLKQALGGIAKSLA